MLDIEAEVAALVALFGTGKSVPLLTTTHPSPDMPTAYRLAAAVRRGRLRRDDPAIGRKIGSTNHLMWEKYEVKAPIWGVRITVRQALTATASAAEAG
ncbi:MAG: hypothetical protein ABIO40_09850 [Devosia sp.]